MSEPEGYTSPTPREGWQMPPPPEHGAVAAYYADGTDLWLHWMHPEDHPLAGEHVEGSEDIEWPYDSTVEWVSTKDLRALGFVSSDY